MPRAIILTLAAVVSAAAGPACALTPDEIVMVIRRGDPDGARLSRYYSDARNVPRTQIIALDLPATNEISWSVYETRVIKPIRTELTRRKLDESTRCLLILGRVPLGISPDPATTSEEHETKMLKDAVRSGTLEFFQQAWRVEQLARAQMPGRPPDKLDKDHNNFWTIREWYQDSRDRAIQVIEPLPADKRDPLMQRLNAIRLAVEGIKARQREEPKDLLAKDYKQQLEQWKKDQEQIAAAEAEARKSAGGHGPASMRDARRRMQYDKFGLQGAMQQAFDDINELTSSVRASALDSELAMLWQDNYRQFHVHGNPLRGSAIDAKPEKDKPRAGVMVCRLDGPDIAQLMRMVDDGLMTEKVGKGVAGKFCIDTRGLPKEDRDYRYDEMLLNAADWTGRPAAMTMVKDTSILVMPATKANPIGFYAGWGGADAFPSDYQCATGAVTLSLNPQAAGELFKADSTRWTNGWLKVGAAATVGAVLQADPYSFPNATEFAKALLVDGRPLAEAYWMTTPFASWRVILIGDPLYKPAARAPANPNAPKAAP
ncbi:MAG: hypothetical protein BIFFINMI_01303 [Phycisphaerae bacterium]|nr:hypothetical protein [Phycisphaerae bacterium]